MEMLDHVRASVEYKCSARLVFYTLLAEPSCLPFDSQRLNVPTRKSFSHPNHFSCT